ncbi:hypothetical protein DER44DRAFT_272358 [Fusarium oxysporum]|nr:hypothetical protein DER44DRAFT_272358 [Fusarium oxysporum]
MHLHALPALWASCFRPCTGYCAASVRRCLQISSALVLAVDGWIAWVNPQWFHQVRDSMISSYRCSQKSKRTTYESMWIIYDSPNHDCDFLLTRQCSSSKTISAPSAAFMVKKIRIEACDELPLQPVK